MATAAISIRFYQVLLQIYRIIRHRHQGGMNMGLGDKAKDVAIEHVKQKAASGVHPTFDK